MNIAYNDTISLATETCCACGTIFAMPAELHRSVKNNPTKSFYCPNGHSMSYKQSEADRLRKEAEAKLALANQRISQLEQELKNKRGRPRK
jgi:hypothetical protein